MSWTENRFRTAIAVFAVLAGIVVYVIGHEVFPYLSVNHDEGVYLQQANLLLQGKLWLTADLSKVFQPWFFIQDGKRLYPKYTPVAAGLFTPGLALGIPRLALSVIAAGNVAFVGLIGREVFDRPTGVLAAGMTLLTPFFLFISATFMSYAPTMLLNLMFAFGYIRMHRQRRRRYAVLAGGAIGLSFFSRPYSAVLFATPFIIHALIVAFVAIRNQNDWRPLMEREAVVALFGLGGVGVALAYNFIVTGNPFLFPYQVFAPLDGLGFGFRRLTGPGLWYTTDLALRANTQIVIELLSQWTFAAPIGSILAVLGLIPVVLHQHESNNETSLPDWELRMILSAVVVSVIVGNIYFWGTFNILGSVADPTDGFISKLGPYYHLDLILSLSVFASAGALWLGRTIRSIASKHTSAETARLVVIVFVIVSAPIIAGAEYNRIEPVVERNMEYTDQYAEVYAPFEKQTFDHALVFLPTPHEEWLAHPFQSLRNGGSLNDGSTLYAQNLGPTKQFATIDAYPNRTPYRFTYRGLWDDGKGQQITPHLQSLDIRNGSHHRFTTTAGDLGRLSSVRLSVNKTEIVSYHRGSDASKEKPVTVRWDVNGTHVRLVNIQGAQGAMSNTTNTTQRTLSTGRVTPHPTAERTHADAIAVEGPVYATLAITFRKDDGDPVTYSQGLAIDANNESARFLWPGPTKVCRGSHSCGREGMYVPGGTYPPEVSMNTTIQTEGKQGTNIVSPESESEPEEQVSAITA